MKLCPAVRPILLTALIAFLCACSRDHNVQKQEYLHRGQLYFEDGKYREAVIEFTNAVQIDSDYAEAHHQLAEAYLKLQQGQHAYQELARTIELQPQNYQARMELANLLIPGGNFQQAQEQTDLLLKEHANDPGVHAIISSLLAGQGNLPGAIEEMQKAIALAPNRWESHLTLALLQTRANQPDAAEANFKKVIELEPTAIQARLLLGTFYQSRNRFKEAEQQFDKAGEIGPNDPAPRASLARLYLAEGRKSEAEAVLQQAKRDFPNNPAGYRLLASFYSVSGDFDKALTEYESLRQEHPRELQITKDYIELLLQRGQFSEAHKLTEEILKADSSDADALVYRSQLQISDGHADDAAVALQNVIKNDPANSEAHYALGVAFDKLANPTGAEREWREAARLRPDLLDAQRALAGMAMRRNDMSALEQVASQLVVVQPSSPEGYGLRALSHINRGQFAAAEIDARKAIDVAPQSSFGHLQMGNLKLAQKDYAAATKAYRDALDRDPNSTDALRGLMNTLALQNQFDKAVTSANAQIAKSPTNSGFYDLLGTALFRNNLNLSGAEAAFRKSVELNHNNFDALIKLGKVQAAGGNVDQAIVTYQQALKDNPREATFHILLGQLYESRQDWNNAKASYQKALEIRSDDPQASNSLAYVMLETGGSADVALSLAQTARQAMPDSPTVADTMGWAYYQKGAYNAAIDLFREALRLADKSKAPQDPRVHYHLGLAYQKTDQPGLAREHLEQVLKINPHYSEANEVKKQLAQLKS